MSCDFRIDETKMNERELNYNDESTLTLTTTRMARWARRNEWNAIVMSSECASMNRCASACVCWACQNWFASCTKCVQHHKISIRKQNERDSVRSKNVSLAWVFHWEKCLKKITRKNEEQSEKPNCMFALVIVSIASSSILTNSAIKIDVYEMVLAIVWLLFISRTVNKNMNVRRAVAADIVFVAALFFFFLIRSHYFFGHFFVGPLSRAFSRLHLLASIGNVYYYPAENVVVFVVSFFYSFLHMQNS